MSELERQLTEALRRLSVQYEREQLRHSGQVEHMAECYGTLASTLR